MDSCFQVETMPEFVLPNILDSICSKWPPDISIIKLITPKTFPHLAYKEEINQEMEQMGKQETKTKGQTAKTKQTEKTTRQQLETTTIKEGYLPTNQ